MPGGASAWFPLKNPALVTVPLSCASGIAFSVRFPEPAALEGFRALERRVHVGGSEPALVTPASVVPSW